MKIRNGFVSNSSSSSFVVALSVLTDAERRIILCYNSTAEESENGYGRDSWDIHEDTKRGVIHGFTSMDNGDLETFLGKELYSKCVCNHEE